MHFIGMKAWVPPLATYYSLRDTLFSVLAAAGASWLAMYLTLNVRGEDAERNLVFRPVVIGGGICGMHCPWDDCHAL